MERVVRVKKASSRLIRIRERSLQDRLDHNCIRIEINGGPAFHIDARDIKSWREELSSHGCTFTMSCEKCGDVGKVVLPNGKTVDCGYCDGIFNRELKMGSS